MQTIESDYYYSNDVKFEYLANPTDPEEMQQFCVEADLKFEFHLTLSAEQEGNGQVTQIQLAECTTVSDPLDFVTECTTLATSVYSDAGPRGRIFSLFYKGAAAATGSNFVIAYNAERPSFFDDTVSSLPGNIMWGFRTWGEMYDLKTSQTPTC